MSLLGYDPDAYFTGRAPIEAAAQGFNWDQTIGPSAVNLVTVSDQIMVDFTADHVSNEEARALLKTAQEQLDRPASNSSPGSAIAIC